MPNPMLHWELNTEDAAKAQKFYADLLGWSADADNPISYGLMQSNSGRGRGRSHPSLRRCAKRVHALL